MRPQIHLNRVTQLIQQIYNLIKVELMQKQTMSLVICFSLIHAYQMSSLKVPILLT